VTDTRGTLGRDKRPDRISGMFDAIAPRYDLLNHLLSAGLDIRWRAKAVNALALRGGETVLDLCTGTGDLAIAVATRPPGIDLVVGVDRSGEMLRISREKLARQRLDGRVRLVQGDATCLPLGAGSVDAATVAFGIRNVQHPESAFAEAFRVLRPGGRFAILEFGLPRMWAVRRAYLAYFHHVLRGSARSCPVTRRRTAICPRQSTPSRSRIAWSRRCTPQVFHTREPTR